MALLGRLEEYIARLLDKRTNKNSPQTNKNSPHPLTGL